MFETVTKPWGYYMTVKKGVRPYTKEGYEGEFWPVVYWEKFLVFTPGNSLSLQSHQFRTEYWLVIAGYGLVTINDNKHVVEKGWEGVIRSGFKHRVQNTGKILLVVKEIAEGIRCEEDDLVRYSDQYGRV